MNLRTKVFCALAAMLTAAVAAQAQVPGVNSTLQAVFNLVYDNSTMKPTYSASSVFVPPAAATDVCLLNGSATKTVKVRRIILSGASNVVQSDPVAIIKRSTANSGGTTGALTEVPYDSVNSLTNAANAATAVALNYTAVGTVGTAVGTLADPHMQWSNLTTGLGSQLVITFGQLGSPVVLRGVAQGLAVNLNTMTYLTPVLSCTFEWTEE